ncbi:metal ABC transporter permease [Gracilibacillus alcaliphilus]|uniref:metal ABC transporter permease n=1 Tax=Gracilibacillus alcaliphilus TaxID=1401441 RepID=UPI001959AC45|nr:metal ABC transporter permease [Gracilibacillus alcaliphilus]MBM7679090.1 manganese/zinc/iron transport system permease protein [Gracilibacillus alcaliphilus]
MWSILLHSNTIWVMLSTTILGIAAGVVGCLAYWKRQNLMSDALSHAALPGVVIAFLIIGEKNLLILVIGAAATSLVGALLIQWVTTSSRITEDTAMGIVLSVFYGFGVMLLSIANRSAGGNQSGLNNFIYGQAAAMVRSDVITMIVLAGFVIFLIAVIFKEWKLYLFDAGFAQGLGRSIKGMNTLYTIILVITIVIGIQAVGVILMAAMLIIPAVSSRYWTHSFKSMIWLSGIFGGMAGALGTWISATGSGLPTGPFIVIVSAGLFLIALLFGKEKGLIIHVLQFKSQQKQFTVRKKEVS